MPSKQLDVLVGCREKVGDGRSRPFIVGIKAKKVFEEEEVGWFGIPQGLGVFQLSPFTLF